MSKRKGAARKRRRRSPKGARGRLAAVAAALNRCEDAGMRMHLSGSAAFTHQGVVAQFKGRKWEARMFAASKDAPKAQPDGLDD